MGIAQRLGLLLLAVQLAGGAAAGEAVSPKVKAAFAKARTERVAVVGIGDSNQRFGGHGWSKYMALALAGQFGCWGSETVWGSRQQEDKEKAVVPPADFAGNSFSYWYLPSGESAKVSWRNGQMHLAPGQPLDLSGPLRLTCRYKTFAAGEGSFQPSLRLDQPPWTVLASSPVLSTTGEAAASRYATVDVPADPARANQPVMGSYAPVQMAIKGPFWGECMRVENLAKTSGLAYHTFYARGGQSLYNMLQTFREEYGEARSVDFFRELRAPLTGSQTCIVMICSGLNDRNCKSASIGPKGGIEPGSSPEAYRDNLAGVLAVLTQCWVKAGGTPETIVFAIMPSHPVATPDDARLLAYRQAAVELADSLPNAGCILLPELVAQRDMAEQKYYDGGAASSPHLSPAGYQALSRAVAKALAE